LLFLGLGANTIWDANEAFYVDTPRHMVESGDYVSPQFNGEPRMNKPVFVTGGRRVYPGVRRVVATERVAIASALGILYAAWLFGRSLAAPHRTGRRADHRHRSSFCDVLPPHLHRCVGDDVMALALACFLLAETKPEHRRRYVAHVRRSGWVCSPRDRSLLFPAATIGTWLILGAPV
jgi:hypothetical protein